MKIEFDTKNWFSDKILTAIIIVGIMVLINMALLISVLYNQHQSRCQCSEMPSWHNYRALIRY